MAGLSKTILMHAKKSHSNPKTEIHNIHPPELDFHRDGIIASHDDEDEEEVGEVGEVEELEEEKRGEEGEEEQEEEVEKEKEKEVLALQWPQEQPSVALQRPPRNSYQHSRVAFLKSTADVERRRSQPSGVTPPYCPSGPTLSRHYIFEDEEDSGDRLGLFSRVRQYQRSLLSIVSRSRHFLLEASSPSIKYSTPPSRKMPHALSTAQTGFQALILCGPGGSLNTFTTVPHEHPKALINLGNRPMLWYVLEWCYRMGVTNITLVTPPESQAALSAALAQNPHLTSLPSPSPAILVPESLSHETATAELLRLPEVQASIIGDFLLLPCDLICDVPGETFLEAWITSLGGVGGATDGAELEVPGPKRVGLGGERGGRRGGLSVWYSTVDREESVRGEECDFFATAKLDPEHDIPRSKNKPHSTDSRGVLRKLAWAMPMSTLNDECEENKDRSWQIRSSLLSHYGSIKCLTKFRDAHIYLFPYWVKDFALLNEDFDSVSEDLVGTWAKTDWRKPAYRIRFGAKDLFSTKNDAATDEMRDEVPLDEEIDLMSLSSTQITRHPSTKAQPKVTAVNLASRVIQDNSTSPPNLEADPPAPLFPPILSYIHSFDPTSPLIRRVDTTPLLLSVSLLLAKIPSIEESSTSTTTTGKPNSNTPLSSPFAHPFKISPTATIALRATVSQSDTLIGDNATVAEKCVIKESVIGPSVSVGQGSRITRCLVMDGAVIGERCTLTDCVVGKKANLAKGCVLSKCEVQDGNVVAEGSEGRDEKFLVGGLEDEANGGGDEFEAEEGREEV